MTYRGVVPHPGPLDANYWDGLRRHELLVQRCLDCGRSQWYPREICRHCHGFSLEWAPLEPVGEIYSFVTQYHKTGSKFDDDVPYTVAVAQLRDAPDIRLVGRLVGIAPDAVRIGISVVGQYLDATPNLTLLEFRVEGGADNP